MSSPPARVDWPAVRDAIDLAAVAADLLGPAPGRRGERGRRLWWSCPFHRDPNPSFLVEPGKPRWRCFGCDAHGDAVDLVRRLKPGWTFPEVVAYLAGVPAPARPIPTRPAGPSGMPAADALALVEAAARLWTPEGADALADLRNRGLADATIRGARLGFTPPLDRPGRPRGIVVPWFDGGRLALVKLRQPEGVRPKYRELYRDRPTLYPGRRVIRHGQPLIIVEGELDALLLGQELDAAELAPVVTLGSASARPDPVLHGNMLVATLWLIATDADPAGDKAAAGWPAVARRVRPPLGKDWTEARAAGMDLARWWRDTLTQEQLLRKLQSRGLRLDGERVYPRIAVGTATGRVAYTDPALQGLPAADRLARLAPVVEGRLFVRADYGQIEPRVMLAVLRRRGSIAWDAGDDLYRDLAVAGDRDTAKRVVNKLINGGRPDFEATGRLAEFAAAVEDYRAELATDARTRGRVATLAGRVIPLAADEANHAGKAVNRVVQGTAADIFHRAAVGIGQALGRLGDVAYLLHDELWVECDPADAATVATLVRAEMMTAALGLGVCVPVRIDPDPGRPAPFSWDQLSRWRWGPAVGDPEPGIEAFGPRPLGTSGEEERGHGPPPRIDLAGIGRPIPADEERIRTQQESRRRQLAWLAERKAKVDDLPPVVVDPPELAHLSRLGEPHHRPVRPLS